MLLQFLFYPALFKVSSVSIFPRTGAMKILFFSKENTFLAKTALEDLAPTEYFSDLNLFEKKIPEASLIVLHNSEGREALANLVKLGLFQKVPSQKVLALCNQAKEYHQKWFSLGVDSVLEYPCQAEWIKLQAKNLLDCTDQAKHIAAKINALEWYKQNYQHVLQSQQSMETSIRKSLTHFSVNPPEHLETYRHSQHSSKFLEVWGKTQKAEHYLLLVNPTTNSPLEILLQHLLATRLILGMKSISCAKVIIDEFNQVLLDSSTDSPNLLHFCLVSWNEKSISIFQFGSHYFNYFDGFQTEHFSSDSAPLGVKGVHVREKKLPWNSGSRLLICNSKSLGLADIDLGSPQMMDFSSIQSILNNKNSGNASSNSAEDYLILVGSKK